MPDQDADLPFQRLPAEEEGRWVFHARLDRLRKRLRREAELEERQSEKADPVEPIKPVNLGGPYLPIDNPGWCETRMLAEWPDWVEEKPWRLLGARDADRRGAQIQSELAAEGRLGDPLKFREPFGDPHCYTPIENPGPSEARALEQHPEWVQRFPWRLVWRRENDRRDQQGQEAQRAAEQLALQGLLAEESDRVFREVVDLELARRGQLPGSGPRRASR